MTSETPGLGVAMWAEPSGVTAHPGPAHANPPTQICSIHCALLRMVQSARGTLRTAAALEAGT